MSLRIDVNNFNLLYNIFPKVEDMATIFNNFYRMTFEAEMIATR